METDSHATPIIPEPPLLEVDNLSAGFMTDSGYLEAIDAVSFQINAGQTLGLVGESGCGKSVTANAILRLLPRPAGRITAGAVRFSETDLTDLPLPNLRAIRGNRIGMIFQEPLTALNPVLSVGRQIAEAFCIHNPETKRGEARDRVIEAFRDVGIPDPAQRFFEYPHQLSGGMRQRAMIAMALICAPELLIADEPTTALDVTTQAQILDLLQNLRRERGLGILLITHDLGVIAENADTVAVMYAGRIVEMGSVATVLTRPAHRYTAALIDCIPGMNTEPKTPLRTIPGRVPQLSELPAGARFAPRSDHQEAAAYIASPQYRTERPSLVEVAPGHWCEDHPVVRIDA